MSTHQIIMLTDREALAKTFPKQFVFHPRCNPNIPEAWLDSIKEGLATIHRKVTGIKTIHSMQEYAGILSLDIQLAPSRRVGMHLNMLKECRDLSIRISRECVVCSQHTHHWAIIKKQVHCICTECEERVLKREQDEADGVQVIHTGTWLDDF